MQVSLKYAQEHFHDLAIAASNGEEVEISLPDQPTLVLLQRRAPVPFKRTAPRILGEGVGEMVVPEWDEWKAIDHELEREVTEQPLTNAWLRHPVKSQAGLIDSLNECP